MGISYFLLILLIAVSVPMISCILKAGAYGDFVAAIKKEDFAGAAYFGLGFAMIDILRIDFKSSGVHKIREQAGILYGRKYADFYVRVLYAQALTYVAMLGYAALFLACIVGGTDGLIFVVLGIAADIAVYRSYINSYSSKLEKLNLI